jgi:histone deacetylase complex regulatory component SIN3
MYKIDNDICNYRKTMKVLEEEKNKLDAMIPGDRDQYKLCPRRFNTLRLKWIERTYAELGQEMLKLLPLNPAKAIPIIYERFKSNYNRALDDKNEQIEIWRDTCEKNFQKSLDHRSFHFKMHEKKGQQIKNYMSEIKGIVTQSFKSKNLNQVKGGSKESEYYCTYSPFEPLCVHSQANLHTQQIQEDHPMNLRDPELLENPDKLPQMRFLLNDRYIEEMSLQLLYEGIRTASQGNTEKDKMRQTIKVLMQSLLSVENLDAIRARSNLLNFVNEEIQDVITNKDYYDLKDKNAFRFEKYSKDHTNIKDSDHEGANEEGE